MWCRLKEVVLAAELTPSSSRNLYPECLKCSRNDGLGGHKEIS